MELHDGIIPAHSTPPLRSKERPSFYLLCGVQMAEGCDLLYPEVVSKRLLIVNMEKQNL